jgi:hypothetical protein
MPVNQEENIFPRKKSSCQVLSAVKKASPEAFFDNFLVSCSRKVVAEDLD